MRMEAAAGLWADAAVEDKQSWAVLVAVVGETCWVAVEEALRVKGPALPMEETSSLSGQFVGWPQRARGEPGTLLGVSV
jgi:hypothetical protein